ncbi:Hydroxyquinol 1,2-dioxygenase [Pseudonocardia dioxanivorans CB1190]|uniref:Hydroxyquinol 1,2-dioxygenase n=1 Tax=Pseudonocardia dioxanivorans (strain ATCC 55486 / DSM 44775 / JCM 13855 / CB1190) TaxID=675635 RepID=F4CS31_PSEUX|nr:dioxygenase [Pseudonocardia dioxanivorans]AEA28475.1 Hydroxyquinol 1,2-dioxygenase [Pseudonocardia dioxanivorans CB1190]
MDFTVDSATPAVQASFDATPAPRLRAILQSLTRHLHDFVREIEPTIPEWNNAIEFLTAVGKACTDTRQEFILLSDVLGVSMLVETINGQDAGTESTVLSPFHMTKSPARALGDSIDEVGGSRVCVVSGTVRSTSGRPLAGATVDVWQCDENGLYDVQVPDVQPAGNGRGLFTTDELGRYWFRTVAPSHYPIPTDGPVGALLNATGRHPYRPAHVHFIASAPAHEEVTTHAFVAGSPYIDSDAVFAVKKGLLVDFCETTDSELGVRYGVEPPFIHATFDIELEETAS